MREWKNRSARESARGKESRSDAIFSRDERAGRSGSIRFLFLLPLPSRRAPRRYRKETGRRRGERSASESVTHPVQARVRGGPFNENYSSTALSRYENDEYLTGCRRIRAERTQTWPRRVGSIRLSNGLVSRDDNEPVLFSCAGSHAPRALKTCKICMSFDR